MMPAPGRPTIPVVGWPAFLPLVLLLIMGDNFFEGEEITISVLNCNSLNMSNSAKWNQTLKICGITKLKSDVIFVSDIRVSNKNLVSSGNDLIHQFLNNPYEKYDFFYNSTKNRRGTGILFKKNCNYDILEQRASEDENILLLRVNLKNTEVVLVSIYGPNSNDVNFFNVLSEWLHDFQNLPIIVGGDWNATYCNNTIENNIDCINMTRPPNLLHSNKIQEMCENFNLMDPYRTLYPDTKDFTYVPRNVNCLNKSRIDFFLISDSLFDIVKDCMIKESLQNKLFDHKAVSLILNRKKSQKKTRVAISKKELDDDLLQYLVHATTAETYLIHWSDLNININKQILINTCGTVKALIRDCGPPFELRVDSSFTEDDVSARNRKVVRLQILINLLDITSLENGHLTCSPSAFMETLLLNIKNEVISHQAFIRKKKFEKIAWLKKELFNLKKNFEINKNDIFRHENTLNTLVDSELRKELSNYSTYDILNSEKMTPRFLSLSKANKKIVSLDSVCKEDGSAFESREGRYRYIRDFYSNIYTPDPGNLPLQEGCIEEFLGPEICNTDTVLNSKLTAEEKIFFDRNLTLQELDKALLKLNENSAGGLDGIPTTFLKKFWPLLRIPLLNYANHAFETGTLTQSFSSAGIKLIPKKGDTKHIKNWRPISLLNSIFKIISKALDFRLQKITEIILSRGQKGFTAKRQMHECIINIIETIQYAKSNKIPAFVLALDMAKAFDTVRHDYMTLVYKFFGLGNNMIKMLNTISTGRTAYILSDEGEPTQPFILGTGFPQGNAPSPNQFNIGEQIFILKCEFDPNMIAIKGNTALNFRPLPPLLRGGGGRPKCL
jgi:exonuclease III